VSKVFKIVKLDFWLRDSLWHRECERGGRGFPLLQGNIEEEEEPYYNPCDINAFQSAYHGVKSKNEHDDNRNYSNLLFHNPPHSLLI
jgi:hypothetical protein